jgi:flagellar basal-body rod modification protein FlgD
MSGTTSAASATALQHAANAAAAALGSAASSSSAGTSATNSSTSNPLASLTSNFSDFLSMLTTQLQNQDPTSPMDSNTFTSELVQFTGVEAQINTNSSLTQLISLQQASTVMQSTELLGKQITVNANELTLQNGASSIQFTAPTAGPVAIAVYNTAGTQIYDTTVNATAGSNTWKWNGQTATGLQEPDGAYNVGVAASSASGAATSLPFTVTGTATAVNESGSTVQLNLGSLTVNASAIVSVDN